MDSIREFYLFLKITKGNWRNSIYVESKPKCSDCRESCTCSDFLFTFDFDVNKLVFISVDDFKELTNENIDKTESVLVINIQMFKIKPVD